MNNKDKLVGQYVTAYLDGGWELSGEIKIVKDDRIFIESNKKMYLVFMNKVSAIWLNSKDASIGESHPAAIVPGRDGDSYADIHRPSRIDLGMSIPFDMLTEEAQSEAGDDDFSISFGNSADIGDPNSGMTFSIDNNKRKV
tara:strand:+ start:1962 stop:2384 length:423 start_codon:yes stop_codon:yes gene_type:complete